MKKIGILGGMGPEATAYFFQLIIKNTKAEKDQDHIPVIVYSNPEVPPRTDAILGMKDSPLPHLLEGIKILEEAGADFLVMPCATAHYYFPQLVGKAKVPFLNLMDETVLYIERSIPSLRKAGLIASTGTIESKLFHRAFAMAGIEIMAPSEEDQNMVMEAILGSLGIKAGYTSGAAKEMIVNIARSLVREGAGAVIAGCTEIPLVLKQGDIAVPLIDPLEIMARASILNAGAELRKRKS